MPKATPSKKSLIADAPLPVEEAREEFAVPALVAKGSDHRSKAEKSVSLKLAEERLTWQQLKNQKGKIELEAKKQGLVELAVIKRAVLQANTTVKQQILAVIERANLPEATRVQLRHDMIAALNELAYEGQHESNLSDAARR